MSYDNIKRVSTIKDLITVGKQIKYTSDKLHFKSICETSNEKFIFNIYSILDRYMDNLESLIEEIELNDKEYIRYKYQPKRLCVDVYDCADLAPLILKINNMTSLLEFNKQTVRLFRTSIIDYLNEIIILENRRMALNERSLEK